MSVEARTWTIERGEVNGLQVPFVRGADVPVDPVEVIELEPILSLLERIRSRHDLTDQADIRALLRTHGRLK